MRDIYIDFGTFSVRVIEDDDTVVAEDVFTPEDTTPPAPFDYEGYADRQPNVEVLDAANIPIGNRDWTTEQQRIGILRQELLARINATVSRLVAGNGQPRNCKTPVSGFGHSSVRCNQPYLFNAQTDVFEHADDSLMHTVKPNSADAEQLVILSSLVDMYNESHG